MKRILFVLAVAALVLPAVALAKGPSKADVNGPGTGGGITFKGDGESGGTPLGDLTQFAGFFPAVFGQQPDPMVKTRPQGTLGPKYTITYTVPGPNNETFTLHQDVYPYAQPSPVTYTKPGQEIFYGGRSYGGWYQAPVALKTTLVAAGLPKVAPGNSASDGDGFFSTGLLSALAAAALLVAAAAAAVVLRRRERPAPAA